MKEGSFSGFSTDRGGGTTALPRSAFLSEGEEGGRKDQGGIGDGQETSGHCTRETAFR